MPLTLVEFNGETTVELVSSEAKVRRTASKTDISARMKPHRLIIIIIIIIIIKQR
jgi:hypothetical protein